MTTLHIYRGIPASGKTTAALEWVAADPENRVRVNRDDIRFMTFGKYWGVDENHVTRVQNNLLITHFKAGRDIVLDNTNLKATDVKATVQLATKWGYGTEFRDFRIDRHEALVRDSRREKQVGEAVINSFFDRYTRSGNLPPVRPEWFVKAPEFPKHEWVAGLPRAIIVDIDGTLAHMNDRGPYDDHKAHTDLLDSVVFELVELHHAMGDLVIVMSGRDAGRSAEVTHRWLSHYRVPMDALHMRPAGDKRNDAIVKNELFEKHVAGKYNVRFALDDRDRVVAMWRAKGIKCLQVEPGDF